MHVTFIQNKKTIKAFGVSVHSPLVCGFFLLELNAYFKIAKLSCFLSLYV